MKDKFRRLQEWYMESNNSGFIFTIPIIVWFIICYFALSIGDDNTIIWIALIAFTNPIFSILVIIVALTIPDYKKKKMIYENEEYYKNMKSGFEKKSFSHR